MVATMRNRGQSCTATKRFLVHDDVFDDLAGPSLGSTRWSTARSPRGARLLTDGERHDGRACFYPPIVLSDVPTTATESGLVGYVYAGDIGRGLRIAEQFDVGMAGANRGLVPDPPRSAA